MKSRITGNSSSLPASMSKIRTHLESGVSMINKADTLANGVSQAMYTTFGGLIVGIFAMAMYDLMRGRLNKLIGGMESACNSVLRRLSSSNRL